MGWSVRGSVVLAVQKERQEEDVLVVLQGEKTWGRIRTGALLRRRTNGDHQRYHRQLSEVDGAVDDAHGYCCLRVAEEALHDMSRRPVSSRTCEFVPNVVDIGLVVGWTWTIQRMAQGY